MPKQSLSNLVKQSFILLPLDVDILFRAIAIIAIIFIHTYAAAFGKPYSIEFVGGSTLLLLISGGNLARFQSEKLFSGRVLQVISRFFCKIILPYYGILIVYLFWKQRLDWYSLFLISNYHGRFGNFLEPYWFLELLLQVLVIFTSLFAIPSFRKTANQYPYQAGLVLLLLSLVLRLSHLTDAKQLGIRTPDQLICIYTFGWCIWFAKTQTQKATMTLLTFLIFPYLYGIQASYTIWLVSGSLMILWKPIILLPKLIHQLIVMIGTSTFYIYLSHIIPIRISTYVLHSQNIPAIIIVSLFIGVAAHKILTSTQLSSFFSR
jgi:hypothetical protein